MYGVVLHGVRSPSSSAPIMCLGFIYVRIVPKSYIYVIHCVLIADVYTTLNVYEFGQLFCVFHVPSSPVLFQKTTLVYIHRPEAFSCLLFVGLRSVFDLVSRRAVSEKSRPNSESLDTQRTRELRHAKARVM